VGTGWTFDGATQYLDSHVIPATNFSMIIQFSNVTSAGEACLAGQDPGTGGDSFGVHPNWYAAIIAWKSGGLSGSGAPILAGNLALAGPDGYVNGVWQCGLVNSITTVLSIYIGRSNYFLGNYIATFIQAFALYDTPLTAPQVLAISTAMAAL
jgi:hypothetical protein